MKAVGMVARTEDSALGMFALIQSLPVRLLAWMVAHGRLGLVVMSMSAMACNHQESCPMIRPAMNKSLMASSPGY